MASTKPDWFDELVPSHIMSIPPYVAGKPVAELERELGVQHAIKLASNENPLGPCPRALEAIRSHLDSAHIYPEDSGPMLRQALAARLGLTAESVILGNGSDELMAMVAHLCIEPGAQAVIPANTFSMYRICVEGFAGEVVPVELVNYRFDLKAMAKAVTSRTRLVFLTVPNNPTGTVVTRGELEAFLGDLAGRKVVLVFDEAYGEFVRDADCPRGLDYLHGPVPILVLKTFSKIYGLAGLRIGYGFGAPWFVEMLNRVRPPFNVNSMAQAAALGALDDTDHVQRSFRHNAEGMVFLEAQLRAIGVQVVPSQANFLTFCLDSDARWVFDALLLKGVIVRHLASFGMPKCIRVSVGTDAENRRFISALKEVLRTEGLQQ
ncbi:MAG: histidinol-phosphate transaminase [Thermodesulfobacteriota bacterium]